MKAHFNELFAYDRWANKRVYELIRSTRPKNDRIYLLFSHIISASRIWLNRCAGRPGVVDLFAERSMPEMEIDLRENDREWQHLLDQLPDGDLLQDITYKNTQGTPFVTPLNGMMMQVINHGTHHRGQIVQLVRQEGFDVPGTDYILYHRQKQK